MPTDSPRLCFFAERQIGIGSAAAALEPYARRLPNAVWTDVTYWQHGGIIERMHLGRIGGMLRGFQQTGAALKSQSFDALFFLTHNPAVLRQIEIAQVPTLLWTDVTSVQLDAQAEHYRHPVSKTWPARALKNALVKRTFHVASLCVGWSEWARKSFVSDYDVPEWKTAVVPPGIDLCTWTPEPSVHPGGLPRLLFIGGDFKRKGGEVLLDVFRRHLRGRCMLDIVTRDPLDDEEGIRVRRNLVPGSPDLLSLYRGASGFVLPTLGDCFSIASMEAMAMGLPVVVSSVGGISEIVTPGRTGFLIRPGDGQSLHEALDALLSQPDLRRTMGKEGRARAEERFDARKVADRLFALLRAVAKTRDVPVNGSALARELEKAGEKLEERPS